MKDIILNMHPGIEVPDAVIAVLSLDFAKPFTGQVQNYIHQNISTLVNVRKLGPVGQSVGALLLLPALEMINGLPEIVLFQPGKKEILGWKPSGDYRHLEVRPQRYNLPHGQPFAGYTLLDGLGKGLTQIQYRELCETLGAPEDKIRILDISMGQIDSLDPTKGMIEKILSSGLTFGDTANPDRILFLPPGAGFVAIWMGLTLYGLCEAWLRTIRLNKHSDEQFHVEEIVAPQEMRQFGVKVAAKYRSGKAPVSVPRELFEKIVNILEAADPAIAYELKKLIS